MPDQPSWIEQVPAILQALGAAPALLDRGAVERVMGLSPRQANRLMRECESSYTVGRSVVVPRDSLEALLRRRLESGEVELEVQRRHRLAETLADARQDRLRQRIVIPHREDVRDRTFDDLSPGIGFEPGLLKISFDSPLGLLEKLFELSQAMSNDFARFEDLATGSVPTPPGQSPASGSPRSA